MNNGRSCPPTQNWWLIMSPDAVPDIRSQLMRSHHSPRDVMEAAILESSDYTESRETERDTERVISLLLSLRLLKNRAVVLYDTFKLLPFFKFFIYFAISIFTSPYAAVTPIFLKLRINKVSLIWVYRISDTTLEPLSSSSFSTPSWSAH